MSLREARSDDLAAIMSLENASFAGDAWSEQTMAAELASDHTRYFVDVDGERVVGYGGVRSVAGSRDADVQTIALDAAVRGQGRGRALLQHLMSSAAELGASELFLDVRADNAVAQALYASEGFVEIGRRPGYYPADGIDAIVMRAPLRRRAVEGEVPGE